MKIPAPEVDYRKLRPGNAFSPEFRHAWMLLYWIAYGFVFWFVEQVYQVDHYYPMYCPLDDLIPFCELFVIPYLFWFVYLVGAHAYTLFYDVAVFKQLMKFVIFTYTTALVIFFLFPNCQQLRPEVFPRDNVLTRFMAAFYQFDTNTNVCPSLHVVGSVACMLAAFRAKGMQHPGWKITWGIVTFLISISTVFLKQHSVLDVLAAIPVCLIGYLLFFRKQNM